MKYIDIDELYKNTISFNAGPSGWCRAYLSCWSQGSRCSCWSPYPFRSSSHSSPCTDWTRLFCSATSCPKTIFPSSTISSLNALSRLTSLDSPTKHHKSNDISDLSNHCPSQRSIPRAWKFGASSWWFCSCNPSSGCARWNGLIFGWGWQGSDDFCSKIKISSPLSFSPGSIERLEGLMLF